MANTYGRGVDRIRAGIVAIDAAKQKTPFELRLDRVRVGTTAARPLGAPSAVR